MKRLIKNVKIITPNEILEGYSLSIDNGKIVDILNNKEIGDKKFDSIIDGQENYLSPGFIDIHNHGSLGYDFIDGTVEAIDNIGKYHLSNGVTSYLGTIITSSKDEIINSINNIVEYKNKKDNAEIIGIHLEGPFFNQIKKGAQPEKYIKKPNISMMEDILLAAKDKMKMVSLAPELENGIDLIRFLKKKNITVSIAHSDGDYEETKKSIENGITVATHLYNGMKGFDHREPGVVGAVLTDDRVFCELIYDRYHIHDIAAKIAIKMKGYDKIILISDAMMAAGLEDGEYLLGGQKVIVEDGKTKLESGSIAGSTLNLRQAVFNLVKHLQVPIKEAVKMASLNAAKSINMDREIGSIEIGKKADLLLFDENINIKKVFLNGEIVI